MHRRLDLDWIRVVAFVLLILYHVGMYYVTWGWHVKSPFASPDLEPFMRLTSPWRLSLLFMVSGVATAYLFARRPGGQGFLGERSWRLLVPLAFGMLVIVTPQAYYQVVEQLPGGYHDGYLAFWSRYLQVDPSFCVPEGCLKLPTWNHLWFVAYLWVYTVLAWALLRFAPTASARVGEALARGFTGLGVLAWPIAWLALARVLMLDRFESTHALVDDWYNHAQYLPLFLAGVLLAREARFWSALEAARHVALAMSVGLFTVITVYYGVYDDAHPAPDALRMLQRVGWAAFQWSAIVAIFGYARRVTFRDGPALRYLREAVFPVYILHQTLIVVLAHNLQPLGLRPAVEGPLLVLATFALSFAGFEVVRRVRWLRPLFGLKANAPVPAAAPTRDAATGA